MKKLILFGIVMLSLVSVVISQSITSKEIKYIDSEKLNLTREEKGRIDSNYNKLGKVIDYQQGTYHTFINFNSGYRAITPNNNFEKMKDEK